MLNKSPCNKGVFFYKKIKLYIYVYKFCDIENVVN